MISALDRKLLRDLWRLKGQVLSIAADLSDMTADEVGYYAQNVGEFRRYAEGL